MCEMLHLAFFQTIIKQREFVDTNLLEGTEYQFRVQAVNAAGPSLFCKATEAAIARDQCGMLSVICCGYHKLITSFFDIPDPPGKPEVIEVTDSSVELKWSTPRNCGGYKILGYILDKKKLPNGHWTRVVSTRYNTASSTHLN